ncbi:MAG: phosphatidylserine decarboxylase [Clostridia bacterium]|nr:phosphatidylserine decarboxylase [Clostridia bacterium]
MILDRAGNEIKSDGGQERFLAFLYNNAFGRVLLKLMCRRFISNAGGAYMRSRLSKGRIKKTIRQGGIDMSEYEPAEYRSFNDFFIRRIRPESRPVERSPEAVISPADSKLTVCDITEEGTYGIKGCRYTAASLLGSEEAARPFYGGKMFIYRLTVDNYHRYCYPDGGRELEHRFIPGILHTVNPIALEKHDVFGKNCREYTLLQTDNFGKVAFVEVGAMMVGRINNSHPETFARGEEKGYFSFGGSTIAVCYAKGSVQPDADIAKNSANGTETAVKYGEKTGRKCE